MKLVTTLLIVYSALFGVEDHDIAMAVFTISESPQGLWVDIEYDQEDYARINTNASTKPVAQQFQTYLNKTTSWVINGTKQAVVVEKITADGHHFNARCHVKLANNRVANLEVYNRFLLEIQDQTNVIMLKIRGDSRGFRMHEGRQRITVGY